MESECPIDAELRNEISELLKPPCPAKVEEYLNQLIKTSTRQCHGITVKHNGDLGKGVYADSDLKGDELLLKDQMLVGIQHSSNKIECLACSFCFRFVGSVELQIGRRLYLQEMGVSANCCQTDYSSDEQEEEEEMGQCGSSSSGYKGKVPLPKGIAEPLMNGELKLPYSDKFSMPPAVPCPGGCGEAYYCSKLCAESDWNSSHSLLCTGERSESVSREALVKFIQHANETNDIFLLAAKIVASTVLNYRKLKVTRSEGDNKLSVSGSPYLSLLLEAWKPISVGHKRRWWDCVALPIDVQSSDEAAFRMQIRELAFTSLQLLKAAIFDEECKSIFSLEIYGHIIGMFELNNLDLVVASPVEDYFLYIDDLPDPIKQEAEEITRPFLDALGDDYSVCCQGTAFYPLQSCMNHSCSPNAKAFKREEDRDGQATIIALKPISKGEEVTISYVDEDIPFEERQALLADYGFRCRCPRCLEEEP
ncbi:histone-lysine N-methyltransferase ATXR2 [Rosa sericea]